MNDKYLSARQAAEYLNVTRQRINSLTKEGRIGRYIAEHPVYTRQELDRYSQERDSKPAGRPKKTTR